MFKNGRPAPANVAACCLLGFLASPRAALPLTPDEALPWGGTAGAGANSSSALQRSGQDFALGLVARPAEETTGGRSRDSAAVRRLGPILPIEGWAFPPGTTLSIESSLDALVFGSGAPESIQLTLLAGYRYKSLTLEVPVGDSFGVEHSGSSVMLVSKWTTKVQCHPSPPVVPMAFTQAGAGRAVSPLASGTPLRLRRGGNALYASTEDPDLVFMAGGEHAFCYTPDGTFAGDEYRNVMIPVPIVVVGVFSPCRIDGCMEKEQWHCYFTYRAEVEGPCKVDIRQLGGRMDWGVLSVMVSRMLWTSAWAVDRYFNDAFLQSAQEPCSDTSTGATIVPDQTHFVTMGSLGQPRVPQGLVVDRETAAVLPALRKETAVNSFTVTVCYCPNYDGQIDPDDTACTHPSEFIQPIGVLYYWMLRICDRQNWARCGTLDDPYARVTPHQPFVLRLQCPAGGICAGATQNRLRIIGSLPSGQKDRQFWDPSEHCKVTKEELASIWWTQQDLAVLELSGGDRRDYKAWHQRYLISTQTTGQSFDVCYCDNGCNDPLNFMMVGQIWTVPSMSVARWTREGSIPGSLTEPISTVESIQKAGSLTLLAGVTSPLTEGILPYDSAPFSRKSLLKLISYDRQALHTDGAGNTVSLERLSGLDRASTSASSKELDRACANGQYSKALVTGPSTIDLAKDFMAYVHGGPSSVRAPFSGRENDQTFRVLQAGVLVVCYCAVIDESDGCADDRYWIAATRLLVKGPTGGASLSLPTAFVVRVDIEGWGFTANDTLRFIGMTQACSENGYSPSSVAAYRLGCPGLNSTDCRLPLADEDIWAIVDNARNTGVYIESLEIGDHKSTLSFSGDITKILSEGDAITIEADSVLWGSRSSGNWTTAERHTVGKLTGVVPYADEPSRSRFLWQKVTHVFRPDGTVDRRKLSVPVGWALEERPPLSFAGGRGVWVRRNRMHTREELKADRPVTLRVCWGDRDAGVQKYYAEVGILSFRDPSAMADAGVYLTSLVQGSKAPAMISFTPRPGRSAYSEHHIAMVLRLLFRDVDGMLEPLLSEEPSAMALPLDSESEVLLEEASQVLCGKLFLEMWTNDIGGFPIPRGCYYSPVYQDSGEADNLPSYREYAIVFEPRAGLKSSCYDGRYQKTGACIYTLVLNARVGDRITSLEEDLVSIHTMCSGSAGGNSPCGPRYSVIEYGAGKTPALPAPTNPNATQVGRVEMAPLGTVSLMPNPFELLPDAVEGNRDFAGFEFRAWAKDPHKPIQILARLRIIFLPLTIWNVGLGLCTARCVAAAGLTCTDGRDGHKVTCLQQAMTRTPYENSIPMQKNSLLLLYPKGMSEVPSSMPNAAHTIEVLGQMLPDEGFFPQRFMAHLTDKDEGNPSMVLIKGRFFRGPIRGTTSGRLLFDGLTGSGPRPFANDRQNPLLVRLSLGATLKHAGPAGYSPALDAPLVQDAHASGDTNETGDANETDPATMGDGEHRPVEPYALPVIRLLLPEDYVCFISGDGLPDPTKDAFQRDDNKDGYLDNYPGTLRLGTWTSQGRYCTYTLSPYATVFAKQVFYVQIRVNNPKQPLLRDDPTNVWYVSFNGTNGISLGSSVPFISLSEEPLYPGWAGNIAALQPLQGESLQPVAFTEGAETYVSVFFQAVHAMQVGSYVVLDAPEGFDFMSACSVSKLDAAYYADWHSLAWGADLTGVHSRTQTLGDAPNCTSDRWNRNSFDLLPTTNFTRARIKVSRRLLAGTFYGFLIRVQNPAVYVPSQHDGWRIWIQSSKGYPVDGSKATVQFNPARIDLLPRQLYDRSWGAYSAPLLLPLAFDFGAPIVAPTLVPILSTVLTVFPFGVRVQGILSSLRIIAPAGYEWHVQSPYDFSGSVPGRTTKICEILTQPVVKYKNELILPDLVLRVGCQHGFQARIRVPTRPPTRSMDAFFFELGYSEASRDLRRSAGTVAAPPLRVVYDASMFSLSNAAAFAENVLEFHLTTATELANNEGFVFRGDEMARGTQLQCWPDTVKDSLLLPSDAQCSVFKHEVTALPMIILSATQQHFPPGHYIFRFTGVENPRNPRARAGYWSMGTYADVHLYPKLQVIDMAANVPSPWVRSQMKDAGILAASAWQNVAFGRDDRPGATNKIVLYFRLYRKLLFPPSISTLPIILRAPHGFVFEEDCLSGVTVLNHAHPMNGSDFSNISGWWPCQYGPVNEETWCPSTIEAWPVRLEPYNCWGSGSSVKISVPNPSHLDMLQPEASVAGGEFMQNTTYAFQITVTNPVRNYPPTMWALDFGHEASKPIPSFVLRTMNVTVTVLHPASMSVTSPYEAVGGQPDAGFAPVSIHFMPSMEVPAPRVGLKDRFAPVPPDAREGSLILQAPDGFTFLADIEGVCIATKLKRTGHLMGDLEAKFREGADMLCTVPEPTVLHIRLISAKSLLADTSYRLEFSVRNPEKLQAAMPWKLLTYMRQVGTPTVIPLDRIVFQGFDVVTALSQWLVKNDSEEYTGDVEVRTVRMTMRFSRPVYNGDTLSVLTTSGVSMHVGAGLCNNFRWVDVKPPAWSVPLPNSPPATCGCQGNVCTLDFRINEGGGPGSIALQPDQELAFELGAVNPSGPAAAVDNYWTLLHKSEHHLLQEAASVSGWPIYGQLRHLDVYITGLNTRAGSSTDMAIKFVPAVWSSVVELVVHEPRGFDFSKCIPNSPLIRNEERSTPGSGRVVLMNGDFPAEELALIPLGLVSLGSNGGQTRISIHLYQESLDLATGRPVARSLNFQRGFRAPGSFNIVEQRLWSERVVEHHEDGKFDEVLPLIPPHSGALTRMEFLFKVTNPVAPGESLSVRSVARDGSTLFEPRFDADLRPSLEACRRDSQATACAEPADLGLAAVQPIFRLEDRIPYGINLTLNGTSPLETFRLYRLRFWCIARSGTLFWGASTQDDGTLPTNTNDESDLSTSAVDELNLAVELFAQRSPPQSVVPVRIVVRNVHADTPDFFLLRVVLPRGYLRLGQETGGANSARVVVNVERSAGTGDPKSPEGWRVEMQVITPSRNVSDTRWFVLASMWNDPWGASSLNYNRMIGWGVAPGFVVRTLSVKVAYAAIPLFSGWIAITFQVPNYMRAKFALVSAPPGFKLGCPVGGNLQPLTCTPYNFPQHTTQDSDSRLTTNVTLPTGSIEGTNRLYSFLLAVTTPEKLSGDSTWNMRILDAVLNTVDSAHDVPGCPWKMVSAQNPTLSWLSQPQGGESSVVSIEITLLTRVKRIVAMLISLPEGYRHDIQHPNQLKNVNKNFPLAVTREWRIYDNMRSVRMLLATGIEGSKIDFVPAGTYQFKFPVMVPMEQPAEMAWYLSMCISFDCTQPDDVRTVEVSFPLPNTRPILPGRVFGVGSTVALTSEAFLWPRRATLCLAIAAFALQGTAFPARCKMAVL